MTNYCSVSSSEILWMNFLISDSRRLLSLSMDSAWSKSSISNARYSCSESNCI